MLQNEPVCNFKIEKSKDNKDVLIINNKYIHSKFAPSDEADNLIYHGKCLIIIFGLGLAYHVNNIFKNNPNSFIIVYEPYRQLMDISIKYLNKDINNNQICLINALDQNKIYDFINKNNLIANTKVITYSNTGYKTLLPDIEIQFFNIVKSLFQVYAQNLMTENNFIPLWTKNFIYNSMKSGTKKIINIEKKNLENNIAVIISAGPTLIEDIKIIKQVQDKITIFVVDTALKPLLRSNIIPDYIISLDGQYWTILDYCPVLPNNSIILYDIISYHEIPKKFNNLYFTVTSNLMDNTIIDYFLNNFKIKINGINTGGTVSDYALNIAVSFGFKNIYFSGLDLSYPDLQTHCVDTPFYEQIMIKSDYFNTLFSQNIKLLSKKDLIIKESKIKNKNVWTDFILNNYSMYIAKIASSYNDLKIFSSKNKGLKINNINDDSLIFLIDKFNSNKVNSNFLINDANKINIDIKELNNFYKTLLNDLFFETQSINDFFNNINFENKNDNDLKIIQYYYKKLIKKYPFLIKFVIMTELILDKKNIYQNDIIWYKHILYKILQSMFFIIRIIQKNTVKN